MQLLKFRFERLHANGSIEPAVP